MHKSPYVQIKSGNVLFPFPENIFIFKSTDKFSHCIGVFIGVFMLVFPLSCYHSITLTNCFLGIYLLKMSCEKRRKWHFRDPTFKNCLGGAWGRGSMPPDRPTWSGPPRHVTFLFVHTPSTSHATPMNLNIIRSGINH